MVSAELTAAEADGRVWRVGFRPEPWAWSGWEWATDGRFQGRWDDLHGNFRLVALAATPGGRSGAVRAG